MYTLDQLNSLPTLCSDQADDLKIETDDLRVWISRCGVEDGEPYPNKVTVEERIDGRWAIVDTFQAM